MDALKLSRNAIPLQHYKDIKLTDIKYRYPMRSAVTLEAEVKQVKIAVSQGFPSIKLEPLKSGWLDVVGYGPSLKETWQEIKSPCITVSGAHDFLCERGIKPDFHAECDGRDHKTKHLKKPNSHTTYLMATICNPMMWVQLEGCNVVTWHNCNGQHIVDWVGVNDPGTIMVAGGSVVGLSAIHLGGLMGYRRFRLFGFDGNFEGETRHAGEHFGPVQRVIEREVRGKIWKTTPQMANSSDELGWLIRDHPELEIKIMGKSMVKDLYG